MKNNNRENKRSAKTINSYSPNIKLTEATKSELDKLKIIPQEPYESLIKRIIKHYHENSKTN